LRDQDKPLDPANRRISLIVRYRVKASDENSEEPAAAEGKSGEEKKPAAEGAAKK
jgi:hypothetical protein